MHTGHTMEMQAVQLPHHGLRSAIAHRLAHFVHGPSNDEKAAHALAVYQARKAESAISRASRADVRVFTMRSQL